MKRNKTKHLLALTVPLLLGLAGALTVNAFSIDISTTFVPLGSIPHLGQPIHEEITREALTNVTPAISSALIVNLQRGVQNSDILHQFDNESHFDNSSVALNVGFSNGFAMMTNRMASARKNALNNPEFLEPHYTSFLDISTDVAAALISLAADPEAFVQPDLTAQAAADAAVVASFLPALVANPNPDPHRATNPRSLFHYPPDPNCASAGFGLCGYFGPVQEGYLSVISTVEDAVNSALGNHFDLSCLCDRDLADLLGSSDSHVVELRRLQHALRAFHAFEDLGHAMHAAQDFFAHSDYVEVMAGVGVGQPIPAGTAIGLPTDFSQFNLAGLQTLMGDARFNLLESGEVLTIWLGDGDFSLGDAGVQNFFNPSTSLSLGGVSLLGFNIPSATVPSVGHNANPFPGFNHGHYLSSSALGLNKDFPSASATDEPSHQNYLPARQAAVQVTSLLWSSFLQSIGQLAAPVVLTCAPDMVVSTDPGQCSATGVDLGAPGVSGGCQTPSLTNDAPAQFPKGTTLVHWIAMDTCSNSATCTQTVLVVDREAPQITCPSNVVAAATTSSGARVLFPTPAATDNCPGVTVSCLPPAGSLFPIGNTTVLCTAIDAANNRTACSFTLHVKGAAEQLQDLIVVVSSFHLSYGMGNSLTSQLREVLAALAVGNKTAAYQFLQTFIAHANAQSGKALTVAQARVLVAAATQVETVIKGSPAVAVKPLVRSSPRHL